MDAGKIKAIVLVVLVGGGAFLGWRFLQDKAAGASDDELLASYSLAPGADATSPYNKEGQRRVTENIIKWPYLNNKAIDKDDKVKQVAYHLMAFVPKASRDEVVKFIEVQWPHTPVAGVRAEMVFALKECALNGMGDKGKSVIKFLATTCWDPAKVKGGVAEETQTVVAKALKDLATEAGDNSNVVHDRDGWVKWYTLMGGNAKVIPEETSNKRGMNK